MNTRSALTTDRRCLDRFNGPEEYFGYPLWTRADEERATEDAYRRLNDDDRYRFEPWTVG